MEKQGYIKIEYILIFFIFICGTLGTIAFIMQFINKKTQNPISSLKKIDNRILNQPQQPIVQQPQRVQQPKQPTTFAVLKNPTVGLQPVAEGKLRTVKKIKSQVLGDDDFRIEAFNDNYFGEDEWKIRIILPKGTFEPTHSDFSYKNAFTTNNKNVVIIDGVIVTKNGRQYINLSLNQDKIKKAANLDYTTVTISTTMKSKNKIVKRYNKLGKLISDGDQNLEYLVINKAPIEGIGAP